MKPPLVNGLRRVEIGVSDVALAERFYVDTWQLGVAARIASTVYLRGTGPAHHLLSLTQTERPEVLAVTLNSPSRKEIEALAQSVPAHGGSILRAPGAIAEGTGNPQAVGAFVAGEFERWDRIVKSLGIQPE